MTEFIVFYFSKFLVRVVGTIKRRTFLRNISVTFNAKPNAFRLNAKTGLEFGLFFLK